MIPTTSPFNLSMQKTDGSLRMTVDYHKLSQVVTPIAMLFHMWFCCLGKLMDPLVPGRELLSCQWLFSVYLLVRPTRSSFLSGGKVSNTLSTVPPQGYSNSPGICHNLVHREFDHLFLPQDILLVNYIDGIMLPGPGGQEVAATLNMLLRHLHVRRWEINPIKSQRLSTSVKCLGAQ